MKQEIVSDFVVVRFLQTISEYHLLQGAVQVVLVAGLQAKVFAFPYVLEGIVIGLVVGLPGAGIHRLQSGVFVVLVVVVERVILVLLVAHHPHVALPIVGIGHRLAFIPRLIGISVQSGQALLHPHHSSPLVVAVPSAVREGILFVIDIVQYIFTFILPLW